MLEVVYKAITDFWTNVSVNDLDIKTNEPLEIKKLKKKEKEKGF